MSMNMGEAWPLSQTEREMLTELVQEFGLQIQTNPLNGVTEVRDSELGSILMRHTRPLCEAFCAGFIYAISTNRRDRDGKD